MSQDAFGHEVGSAILSVIEQDTTDEGPRRSLRLQNLLMEDRTLIPDLLDGVDMQLILGQDFATSVNVKDGWLSFNDEEVSRVDEGLQIEISNGNGVEGIAGRLRNYLQSKGSSVVRLTNADYYGYSESTLFYRPGNRAAAEELLLALPVKNVSLQESANLSEKVDARLLLGRDFIPHDIGPGEI